MSNTVKEAFKDILIKGNIIDSEISNINLFKRSKRLEIYLKSDKEIGIEELNNFDKYLKDKFEVIKVEIYIDYSIEIKNTIKEDWGKIINYLSSKYPIVKTILKTSNIEIDKNKILVILKTKNAEFMYNSEFDKITANLISNLYGKKYKVEYKEEISEEINQAQTKYLEEIRNKECKEKLEAIENNKVEVETKNIEELEEEIEGAVILGKNAKIKEKIMNIVDLSQDYIKVAIEGKVIEVSFRELRNGKILITFSIYDGTSTATCKSFVEISRSKKILERINNAKRLRIAGNLQYDTYAKDLTVIANKIIEIPEEVVKIRKDDEEVKRVELHMHTQMSQMDGVSSVTSLIKRAASWGMKAIAVTDHGVVQAFPEAKKAASDENIKVIYGVEAYLVSDKEDMFSKVKNISEYCVFDIETTGLQFRTDKITEIGALKIKNGQVIDKFETLVNPEKHIPDEVSRITNITDDMVIDFPKIKEVMPDFLEFIEDLPLVAHNADFDIGFIRHNCEVLNHEFKNEYIDTLALSRALFPEFKRHKLEMIAENLGIKVERAHRALDDVKTLNQVFEVMIEKINDDKYGNVEGTYKTLPTYHAIILVKDYEGLRNLYKLISISHLEYFHKRPRILKSLYRKYSKGLIMGSACEQGEIYKAFIARKI